MEWSQGILPALSILKHEVFLHLLMNPFQFIQIRLVMDGILVDSAQLMYCIFESSTASKTDGQHLND